jgi:hypothetical protein
MRRLVSEGRSAARFYFSASDFRRRMISARLRNELFTALAFGKTFATSGSNTTTLLPRVWRRAYFPRTPFEKSYSRSISLFFSGAFFMIPSFSCSRLARSATSPRSRLGRAHRPFANDRVSLHQRVWKDKAFQYQLLFRRSCNRESLWRNFFTVCRGRFVEVEIKCVSFAIHCQLHSLPFTFRSRCSSQIS